MSSIFAPNRKIRHFVAIKRPHVDNNNQVREATPLDILRVVNMNKDPLKLELSKILD